ncbi:signal recognition particle-docking protein FtsY, partial [Dietzia sp. DQ11-38-2]|nr:signal recognition particle-docking protein FtsY [Dietzia sp. DQ11-38-2]
MNTTWIVIAVVAVLLLALLALVVGLQLRKRRQISLSRPEERRELTREERSGNYQAGTGFSFTEAGGTATAAPPREPLPRQTPPPVHTTPPVGATP